MNNYYNKIAAGLIAFSFSPARAMDILALEETKSTGHEEAAYRAKFLPIHPEFGGMCYLDTKPDAAKEEPAIIFLHGNSLDKYAFKLQLASDLLRNYRLISVDLPGHGESFRAIKPEEIYTYDGYSDAVLAVIKKLGLTRYVLAGWSLGGHVAMDMYANLKQCGEDSCLRGLALTGSPPLKVTPEGLKQGFADHDGADPEFMKIWTEVQLTYEQGKLFAGLTGYDGTKETEFILDAVHTTDGRARLYIVDYIMQSRHQVDARALLETSDLPVLMVAGGADEGINNDYIINGVNYGNLWSKEVFVLSGIGHAVPVEAAEDYNKLLSSFAKEVFGTE